jgi:rare lipoprotein A (peptidoglycan hydrolase)
MRHRRDRDARKHDLGRLPRRGIRRLAISLTFLAVTIGAGGTAAQATTGGASSYGGSSPEGQEIAFSPMRSAGASWYGPGLWGRKTACGKTLRPHTLGVAHKTLPCGTTVKFLYRGHVLITQVIDRGPYV